MCDYTIMHLCAAISLLCRSTCIIHTHFKVFSTCASIGEGTCKKNNLLSSKIDTMQPGHLVAIPAPMVHMPGVLSSNAPRRTKYSCAVKTLGILQIVMAGTAVLLGAINVPFSWFGEYGCPIWAGLLFFLPAGILCILVAVLSLALRQCLLIACLVMSIIAACSAGVNMIVSGMCIYYDSHGVRFEGLTLALSAVLMLVALAEIVFAVLASVYCCLIMAEEQSTNKYPHIQYMAMPAYPSAAVHSSTMPVHGYATTNPNTVTVNQSPPPSYATHNSAPENEAEKQGLTA